MKIHHTALWIGSLIAVSSLTACTTNITPVVTGGSKSDGIVTMGYQYGYFQKPKVDLQTANNKATQMCTGWGYSRAQVLDGVETQCYQQNALGTCLEGRVKLQYQCVN